MIPIAIVSQFLSLGISTVSNIIARHNARESLSSGEKIRNGLAQTGKNTAIYDEIVAEAQKQIAERSATIGSNLGQLNILAAELNRAALPASDAKGLQDLLAQLKEAAK